MNMEQNFEEANIVIPLNSEKNPLYDSVKNLFQGFIRLFFQINT